MFEGIDMFEILMGLAILWIAWLVSMIWETDYDEDAYRRTMRDKVKRNKDVERTTTTKT
jgi:hypothetical protein